MKKYVIKITSEYGEWYISGTDENSIYTSVLDDAKKFSYEELAMAKLASFCAAKLTFIEVHIPFSMEVINIG